MTPPFSLIDSASQTIDKLANEIATRATLISTDSIIVFVCGANSTEEKKSHREELLDYANRHLKEFRFFRAEEVFQALSSDPMPDLLSIEDKLGYYSDCIILICESESAFAELGAFALSDELIEKLLVINNKEFIASESFINLGPIAKADRRSKFRPTIFANFGAILKSVPDVGDRLKRIPHKRRRRLFTKTIREFRELGPKLRLIVLSDLIALFSPITRKEMIEVLKAIFPDEKTFEISTELALANSLGMLSMAKTLGSEEFLIAGSVDLSRFLSYSTFVRSTARSWVIRSYYHGDRARLKLLTEHT